MDFDLTKETYIKEEINTDLLLKFFETQNNDKAFKSKDQEIDEFLKQLSDQEIDQLYNFIKNHEKDLISNMDESEIQEHYLLKIKNGYLREPFDEAKKVAEYFNKYDV